VHQVFLRAPDGTITALDVPGAVEGALNATFYGLSPTGAIAGFVVDSSNVNHGFVRAHDGTVPTFDPAGSLATLPFSINPSGAIAGFYTDSNAVSHGFVREPTGTIRTFDAPSAGAGARQCTVCIGNNPAGMLSGYYADASNVVHGFVATGKP